MTAFVANTNIIELLGLKSEVEDTYINDATVGCTIKDSVGSEVTGATYPITMAYIADSNGNYRGTLPDTLLLLSKKKYKAIIEVDAGPDRIGHWEFPFTPLTRTGTEADNG